MARLPTVPTLLATAVDALGGARRDGQVTMASAVADAIDSGAHLAVQAGTGTGKSLAYLVPALRHAAASGKTVVVSTATIALQRQLVERDLPRVADALTESLGERPDFAILKGRANYLCKNKLHAGTAVDEPAELFDAFALSRLGREVTRIREWAETTETGDRDDLSPGVGEPTWRQVSVSARECLGAGQCPFGTECFAELAKAKAGQADIVVTNHAMLAIDAMTTVTVLPEHDVVVIDEAHELVDRVTSVATAEISAAAIAAVARRCGRLVEDELADALTEAGELLGTMLAGAPAGQWLRVPDGAAVMFAGLRDLLWKMHTAIGPVRGANLDPDAAAARSAALTAVDDLHDTLVRMLAAFEAEKRRDVVWLAVELFRGDERRAVRVAPLSVGGLLRTSLFANATVVLTSATLATGGSFDALAATWGLPPRDATPTTSEIDVTASGREPAGRADWTGLDVGSPFDHARRGILYIARHLPPPGRGAATSESLDELAELVAAARGRTLGLFSSTRAAKEAAAAMRERLDVPILCQGDDQTSTLVTRFAEDEPTCLFGTLTLWQGVDVPGPSLSLVVIDRIPFPRPDDPLLQARQDAVTARGGNGFMSVAANHAALLLAQGTGRLLRSIDDRGVIAVLDPRLATARYGGFLRASLPPYWPTSDPTVVRGALARLP